MKLLSTLAFLLALGGAAVAGMLPVAGHKMVPPDPGQHMVLRVSDHSGADGELRDDDHVLGDPKAGLVMVAYESMTCGHCASFHRNTLPMLREHYVNTGKLRIVFRDFPLDGVALRQSMIARCVRPSQAIPVMETFFALQGQIVSSQDPVASLLDSVAQAGIDRSLAEKCIQDEDLARKIIESRSQDGERFGIQSTPTFIFPGTDHKIVGAQPFRNFRKLLDELLGSS